MDDITYAALRLACNRINAIKKVDAIIPSCSSFKIGKTGETESLTILTLFLSVRRQTSMIWNHI